MLGDVQNDPKSNLPSF